MSTCQFGVTQFSPITRTHRSTSSNYSLPGIFCLCQKKIQRVFFELFMNRDTSNRKLVCSSEAEYYNVVYKVKMRKSFNLWNYCLLHNGHFQMTGTWLKIIILYHFSYESCFFYDFQSHYKK